MHFLQQVILGFFLVKGLCAYRLGQDPFHRREILDSDNRFQVDWKVDRINNRITFNLTVDTRGWIRFGFANNASDTTGKDVVVGGLLENGDPYLWDGNTGESNLELVRDASQDYQLEEGALLDDRFTFLSFSRNLDTCDPKDYPITENKVTLVWAYGEDTNEVGGNFNPNFRDQGSYEVYLLDPEYTPSPERFEQLSRKVLSAPKIWTIFTRTAVSQNVTTYLCSVHKAPSLPRKHHVIGVNVTLPDEASQRHVHHLIITKCRAPRGTTTRALFEDYYRTGEGQAFVSWLRPVIERDMPTIFCSQIFATWALGGRIFFIPDDVGLPFGEEVDEYYLLQTHYDNIDRIPDATASVQVDFFYTANLRPNEGGVIMIGHDIPGLPTSMLIPPKSSGVRQFGHCASECTNIMFPPEGITVVAGFLHSHYSGRQARLRHFRGNQELPWIIYDDNYNPRFQQGRALPQGPIKILPGDQLSQECIYDNTWTNGTTVGGYATNQEMCLSFLLHYTYIPDFAFCRSDTVSPESVSRFLGIGNATWYQSQLDWVAMPPQTPSHLVGRTVAEISDSFTTWDPETRQKLREFQEGLPHTGLCGRDLYTRDPAFIQQTINAAHNLQRAAGTTLLAAAMSVPANVQTENEFVGPVDYPRNATPYQPPASQCEFKSEQRHYGWPQ